MKQLSALGARRHAFFRSPRRMRPLMDRLEPGELIPNGPFSYYGGERRFSASLTFAFLVKLPNSSILILFFPAMLFFVCLFVFV